MGHEKPEAENAGTELLGKILVATCAVSLVLLHFWGSGPDADVAFGITLMFLTLAAYSR